MNTQEIVNILPSFKGHYCNEKSLYTFCTNCHALLCSVCTFAENINHSAYHVCNGNTYQIEGFECYDTEDEVLNGDDYEENGDDE
jgi:hypothetical protein